MVSGRDSSGQRRCVSLLQLYRHGVLDLLDLNTVNGPFLAPRTSSCSSPSPSSSPTAAPGTAVLAGAPGVSSHTTVTVTWIPTGFSSMRILKVRVVGAVDYCSRFFERTVCPLMVGLGTNRTFEGRQAVSWPIVSWGIEREYFVFSHRRGFV